MAGEATIIDLANNTVGGGSAVDRDAVQGSAFAPGVVGELFTEGAVFGAESDWTAEPVSVDPVKFRRSCQWSINLNANTVGPISLDRDLPAFCLDFLAALGSGLEFC